MEILAGWNIRTIFREFTGIRGQFFALFAYSRFYSPVQRYRDILRRKKAK
jgi:hypothetical protein